MDKNINTDELSERNANENDWVLINRFTQQIDDNGTVQSLEVREDLVNKTPIIQTANNGIEVLHENIDRDDTSNDVSVITESDTDALNENFFSIINYQDNKINKSENMIDEVLPYGYQLQNKKRKRNTSFNKNIYSTLLDCNIYRPENMVDKIIHRHHQNVNRSKDNIEVLNTISYILLGCIIGIFFGYFSLTTQPTDDRNLYTNEIKNLQTECRSIINTFKEVNVTLHEIKAHIIENNLNKDYAWQLLKSINYPNQMNNKLTIESFSNDPYLIDHLQVSLNILSLLNNIYDSNSLLKSEMNKTLNVVNNTKVLYETLIMLNNNAQNMNVSAVVEFLQNAISKIHHTSRSLVTDLVKKISNIMVNVYKKYSKMRHKLNEKMCHLKNMLPDSNNFLKELTEKSQLLSNFDEYCYSRNISVKFNDKTSKKQNTRTNDIKKQTKITGNDSVLATKFEKRDTQIIDTEICCNKVTSDIDSQPTEIVGKCMEETLNNSLDEIISKQNAKVTSDYEKITADKTKVKRPKSDNNFKSYGSAKKAFNTDKSIEKKNMPQVKMRNYISKSDESHYKRSFKNKPREQDYHETKNADWLFKRSNARQKLRQVSNAYAEKVFKTSNFEVKMDATINDIVRKFGKSIDKTIRFFERKIEDVLKSRSFFKKQ